jgi:hypothetical protein
VEAKLSTGYVRESGGIAVPHHGGLG